MRGIFEKNPRAPKNFHEKVFDVVRTSLIMLCFTQILSLRTALCQQAEYLQ